MNANEAINMWNRSYKQIATQLVTSMPNHEPAKCWKGWLREFRAFADTYKGKINPVQSDLDAMKNLATCIEIVLTLKKREDEIAAQTKAKFDAVMRDIQGMLTNE